MPITSDYQVKCDVCLVAMEGNYETRDDAEQAREGLGWADLNGGTACPNHNTSPRPRHGAASRPTA